MFKSAPWQVQNKDVTATDVFLHSHQEHIQSPHKSQNGIGFYVSSQKFENAHSAELVYLFWQRDEVTIKGNIFLKENLKMI